MHSKDNRDVFEQIWNDPAVRTALVKLYQFEQGLGPYPGEAVTERLQELGLALPKSGRFILTRLGTAIGYNLREWQLQVVEGRLKTTLDKLGVNQDASILDFGCGGGQTLLALSEYRPGRLTGLDRDPEAVSFARFLFQKHGRPEGSYEFQAGSLAEISKLPDASFSHVICRGVLHKVRAGRALELFSRKLKPGGRLYLLILPPGYYLRRLNLVLRSPAWLAYFLVVFLNGCLFSIGGLQVTFRLGNRRLSELYFTRTSLARKLEKLGFETRESWRSPETGLASTLELIAVKRPGRVILRGG